ncbi:MAG: hypothetical protein IT378_17650 [Sandaracinaceae bacterium]|nr:hypothetical protein [Sandaracinaceae bacterium]
MLPFVEWRERLGRLEAALAPIAKRPVRIEEGWPEEVKSRPPAVDEAGVRSEAEALAGALVAAFVDADDETRAQLRKLVVASRSFAWAAWPRTAHLDAGARLRVDLAWLALTGERYDPRDLILAVDRLVRDAREARLDVRAALREAAAMAADAPNDLGSPRAILARGGFATR